MRKIILPGLIAALAFSSVAQAELEVSGNVTTVTAFQYDGNNATGLAGGAGAVTQGDFGATLAPRGRANHFRFMVDQVELDLENEFGENIRARADIDVRDVIGTNLRTGAADFLDLEQGYVTANLGIGNGMEFLIGKFNSPLGLESNDRHENVFSTYTPGYVFLHPKSLIGAKIYYEFNDNWSMDFAVVNSLNGIVVGNSAYPSALLRFGAMWGDEGNESYLHFAFAGGPERSTATDALAAGSVSSEKLDLYGTIWGNWSIGDFWDIGWEAIYRQSQTRVAGATSPKAVAGQLYAVYAPSDVWTVQWRAATHWEMDPPQALGAGSSLTGRAWNASVFGGAGWEGMLHTAAIGGTYQIADDAQMKLEYRFDFAMADNLGDPMFHAGVAEFAYSF